MKEFGKRDNELNPSELQYLRGLAERLTIVAQRHEKSNAEKLLLWKRVNKLKKARPMVITRLWEYCWHEVLPDSDLLLKTDLGREWERNLRQTLWLAENLRDDRIVEPVIEYDVVFTGYGKYQMVGDYGIEPKQIPPAVEGGAWSVEPTFIHKADIEKLTMPSVGVNWVATNYNREIAQTIANGVCTVRARNESYEKAFRGRIIDDFFDLRGYEQGLLDMAMDPEWVHEVLEFFTQHWIQRALDIEKTGILQLNNGTNHCFNGGIAYTDELPAPGFSADHVRLKDLWSISVSEACTSVSPEMHNEFGTYYEKQVYPLFGLVTHGCCEIQQGRIQYLRDIANLRRISISEWNDIREVAREIGTDYVFSFKPTGAQIGAMQWDEEWTRSYLKDCMEQAEGTVLEIINNIGGSCHGEPQRLIEWTNIAMELARRYE